MDVYKVIKKRRSIRKFQQKKIKQEILKQLIDCARVAPSAANLQPLEYVIINDKQWLDKVFETLSWAAYIAPEGNPGTRERPVSYIIVLVNKNKEEFPSQKDVGAAVENILLTALSKNIASCWLGAINRKKLSKTLNLPNYYRIDSVIALGYPAEESIIEKWQGDVRYFKDKNGKMHVPKRELEDVIYDVR